MKSDLCVGICSKGSEIEITAIQPGGKPATVKFQRASQMNIEAIKSFLAGYSDPVRLAITGVAALSIALRLGNAPQREVFIVSPAVAPEALTLAHYAEKAI